MYTRVYQGGKHPLPEDYHGTAFSKEDEMIQPTSKEDGAPKEEESAAKDEEILSPLPPCKDCEEETKEEACASDDGHFREEAHAQDTAKRGQDGWQGELLLVALCALLIECDEPDSRLLALLLLLLLSGNT